MTIADLIKVLECYPAELEVVCTWEGTYHLLNACNIYTLPTAGRSKDGLWPRLPANSGEQVLAFNAEDESASTWSHIGAVQLHEIKP